MYSRLFGSILDSSINVSGVPATHRWLWITMLIIADEGRVGVVNMPVERLAARAGLSIDDTVAGLLFLNAPDPESRSEEEDGRRIVPLRDGSMREWKLVNWEKYQAIAKEEQRREETRVRVANWRKKNAGNADVTESNALEVTLDVQAKGKENRPGRKRPEISSFADDSPEMTAARYLFRKIRENNAAAMEPNFQKWARAFDAILRIDRRAPELVRRVIDASQADQFWFRNILSPDALRKHFDKLVVATAKAPASKPVTPTAPYKYE